MNPCWQRNMTAAEKRVALVTGAGSGIGRAAALALQGEGYHVFLTGRREDALQATAAEAQASGGAVHCVPADVASPEEVSRLFQQIQETYGRLDVLFNNAGVGAPPVGFDELTFEDWKRVVDINLNGAFLCAQAAFRMMREQTPQGGRIINNGSISAQVPRPNSAPYTATKHAITGLTRSLSLDGRPYRIACSQLDIGNAETPMTARMKDGVPQANGTRQSEPVMGVQHVADSVVLMANLPLEANVQFMTLMATNMPFIGRG